MHKTLLQAVMLAVLLACLTGCAAVDLHPMIVGDPNQADMIRVPAGQTVTAPTGKDGWWVSDRYIKEVMQVRIGE